jgi:hypothetical protein
MQAFLRPIKIDGRSLLKSLESEIKYLTVSTAHAAHAHKVKLQ